MTSFSFGKIPFNRLRISIFLSVICQIYLSFKSVCSFRRLLALAITDIICDYLEVIIHEFFYYTHYYDPGIIDHPFSREVLFERRTKYNVIVYMCRSPDVIIYVENLVKSLRQWLSRVSSSFF